MKCSDCKGELKQAIFRGIKIDTCTQCKGRWFDRDELKKAKDNTDEDLRWLNFNPFSKEADSFKIKSEKKKCPKCLTNMSTLNYEESNVAINKCNKCLGVWIHSGEFKKIILYLEKLINTLSSGDYAKGSVKQLLDIAAHPQNIESGIKDFLVILKLLKLKISIEHPSLTEASDKIFKYLPFL